MKATLGTENCLFPMPTVLVGANVNGKPNYMAVAWDGVMDSDFISVSIGRTRHTHAGIKENKTFSVNIPSFEMLKETDYCGIVSGKDVDKAALFENFYGKLGTAPMIQECPINMECRLVQTIEFLPSQDVFIGEIIGTYCDDKYLTKNVVDFAKVQPILFVGTDKSYWKLGERWGKIGSVGKELKTR
jgi:flavin reductase (DIM6/NTAB) family NADH-FMN oxidoreductase RutF